MVQQRTQRRGDNGLCQGAGNPQAKRRGNADAGGAHPIVEARDEHHHGIHATVCDGMQQRDAVLFAKRQVQHDDVVGVHGDPARRLV